MQPRLRFFKWTIPFLLIVLYARVATPQSHNREAMKWFDAGLAEKNAAKRIAAYTQAVEIDPNFAEALFNLGAAHKEQKNYDRAEQYFRRAANAGQNNLRVKALSEMANIYNIRGNSKSSEGALREARTLTNDPQQRAVLSYELGRLLYQQGRYEQAVAELKVGRAGDPGQREAFDNLLKLAENSSRLDDLYATAEKQKAGGNLNEAKAALEQIKAKNANFREVQARLAEIEVLLIADAGKTTIAVAPVTGNVNDEEAEKAYAEGMMAIRKRDWLSASAAFERALQFNPNYRDARQKLAGALMYLERDNVEAVAARYYDAGVAAMNRNDLDSALVALGKVQKINRKYRDVAGLYAQVEAARRNNPAAVIQSPPANVTEANAPDTSFTANLPPMRSQFAEVTPFAGEASLESLYQIAAAAFARGDWNEAMLGFQKIRMRQADYRDVDQLFAAARAKLLERSATAKAAETINLSRPSPLMLGGLAVAVMGFFAVGFIFFSPVARARYQSRRGNHEAAMLIYESLLARRPSRMKLYPALAEIYLKLDRRDEAAMKVYRRVLELNLPSPRRAELSTIVALDWIDEKPANGKVTVENATSTPETDGVLLADDGFHQAQEKTPARRPREKKEADAPLNGITTAPIAEKIAAESLASEALQATAPAKPRRPRKKKEAPANGSYENVTVADHRAANGELSPAGELPAPDQAPAKKPRRKKVTVIDTVSASGMMADPVGESVVAPEANLRGDDAALAEIVLPAESESLQNEPVSV